MKRIILCEYQARDETIEMRLLDRLRDEDERQAGDLANCMFDWTRRRLTATNMVGLMQVPGLCVEVLPKVDAGVTDRAAGTRTQTAQHNLLYMLWYASRLPITRRGLAELRLQRLPMLESLIAAFSEALLAELSKGVVHSYIYREDSLRYLRGRLLFDGQIKHNPGRADRFFVGFDEFDPDGPINRLLKLSAALLVRRTRSRLSRHRLNEALLLLADVQSVSPAEALAQSLQFDRRSERFALLARFAKAVVAGMTPLPSVGSTETFSYSLPMEQLFEEFVAQFVISHRRAFDLTKHRIRVQSRGASKYLLQDEGGRGRFALQPDLLIEEPEGQPALILDTKWKHVLPDGPTGQKRVSQSDMYQLYAYASRFGCPDNVLLFPSTGKVEQSIYVIPENASVHRLRINFIDVSQDLYSAEGDLVRQMQTILGNAQVPGHSYSLRENRSRSGSIASISPDTRRS